MKTEITANEFSNLITSCLYSGKFSTIDDKIIVGNADIRDTVPGRVAIDLVRCEFKDNLRVAKISGASAIGFKDCIFYKSVFFDTVQIIFSWYGSEFKDTLTFNGATEALDLQGFSIKKELRISGYYDKSLTLEKINQNQDQCDEDYGSLLLQHGSCGEFAIKSCNFYRMTVTDIWIFRNIANVANLKVGAMSIMHLEIGNWLRVRESTIEEFQLDNLRGNHKYVQICADCSIGNFSVALQMIDRLEILDSKITTLRLWGNITKDAVIEVRKTTFNLLQFDEVFNEGRAAFRNVICPKGATLAIVNSTLGKTDFIACDIQDAIMEFENSKVTEIFIAESTFPRKVTSHGLKNHSQAELVFGQLRTAMEKQGHTAGALEFHSREIEAHYHWLPWLWPKRFLVFNHGPNFSKISLWLNKWSNDFGRSWIKGLRFTILVGLFCFYLLVISTKEYSIGWGLAINGQLIDSYVRFMNPLRFFDLEALFKQSINQPSLSLTPASYLIDFIGRVLIAYGYYQTIQAFRKYGRK